MKKIKHKILGNQVIPMCLKYNLRKKILDLYIAQKITRKNAIKKLVISLSQFKKIVQRYKREGTMALVHKARNKSSNNAKSDKFKQKVIELYKNKYSDWNYAHASDKMNKLDSVVVSESTLRRWLLQAGITMPQHKKKAYFKRREPRAGFGDLVQVDGTFYNWFGDGHMYCLMHFVDDATKTSLAMLFDGETTFAAMTVLKLWCQKYGIPTALYMDRDSVYKVNDKHAVATIEDELEGHPEARTNFAKVCDKLGIRLIFANTPQAKGRVERRHAIFQDRFVKELTLFGIKTIEDANEFLTQPNGFLDDVNKQFTISAKEQSTCIKLTETQLYQIFTIDESRIVHRDYTVQFKKVIYQLVKSNKITAKSKVTVKIHLDHKISIYAGANKLAYTIITDYKQPTKHRVKVVSPYLASYIRSKFGVHRW